MQHDESVAESSVTGRVVWITYACDSCACVFYPSVCFSVFARKNTEIQEVQLKALLTTDFWSNKYKILILEWLILNPNSSRNDSDCWSKCQLPVFLSLVQLHFAGVVSNFYLFILRKYLFQQELNSSTSSEVLGNVNPISLSGDT